MLKPNNKTCVIEMTPARRDSKDLDKSLDRFAERFKRVMDSGFVAAISDNVMGIPHFQPCELIEMLNLHPRENQVIVHINTFHPKAEIDTTLKFCQTYNISNILCLTGDGSEQLHKLQHHELGLETEEEVTSVDLIKYIKRDYPHFGCGVAFNPYEPENAEFSKMCRKVEAGADFVITQPVLDKNPRVDRLLMEYPDLPVVIECWMSKNLSLLSDLIGVVPDAEGYNGFQRLLELREIYPKNGNCMSMIGFKKTYSKVEDLYNKKG